MRLLLLFFLLWLTFMACDSPAAPQTDLRGRFPVAVPKSIVPPPPLDYDSSAWVELQRRDPSIILDIRYATDRNFMEQQIYDCGRCFYRPEVAEALLAAQRDLARRGVGLKMYDCYRPGPYQQRLWDVLPDARYVARPSRGSAHSRGAAADLTLVDLSTGVELDMGTPYDFFGEEAYTTTTDLPDTVLANRQLLQETLLAHGFSTIRTEWWHFNYGGPRYPLSDWVWPCP
ncbi:M15 family metallopeptidase [Lewinella sp. IMCC34191]|uniref:M15 family metallopeptidase n=1 Tax=Lewinella sp. IMCC34191 TaxID=2259172 RepID=UPI001E42161B|nr:M15 family metallopeptidase [Lewinella sp. IMCC34191]